MRTTERSELLRMAAERVDAELLSPVRRTMGEDTPAERTALAVLEIVAETEATLAGRWITLQEAVDRSGYSYDTLVRRAKAIHDGEDVDATWAGMEVRKRDSGPYEVQAGTLPTKPGRS